MSKFLPIKEDKEQETTRLSCKPTETPAFLKPLLLCLVRAHLGYGLRFATLLPFDLDSCESHQTEYVFETELSKKYLEYREPWVQGLHSYLLLVKQVT